MQQSQTKNVIFLSLFGFFLAALAISFHHHDNSFSLPTCSICTVKASLTGTFNNVKADSTSSVAGLQFLSIAVFLCSSGMFPDKNTVFIDSQGAATYPNKAPPFPS